MRNVIKLAAACAAVVAAVPSLAAGQERLNAVSRFRVQEVDKSLKVGYGVRLVDLNADKRPDIVVADSARVIWFENPGGAAGATSDAPWKLHTIIENAKTNVKTDNVCLDVYDIDDDGKLDVALGADWQPANTKAGGSLHWLRQGATIDEPWAVHAISSAPIPTLHRVHFGDLDGDGRKELIVGPLKGANSTMGKNFMDVGTPVIVYKVPADPAKDRWEPRVLDESLHVMHNFLPVHLAHPMRPDAKVETSKGAQVLAASYEGVNLLTPTSDGKATVTKIGAGNQDNPKGSHGSSEVKLGRLKDRAVIATIEPFHGVQVVAYTPPADPGAAPALWTRTVLDDTLKEGHGIWLADLDGDGSDEVVAGWRSGKPTGVRVYQASVGGEKPTSTTWQKHDLDVGGVAVEDLACADLDADGKIDIVAVGRATGNVRVYWNEGKAAK